MTTIYGTQPPPMTDKLKIAARIALAIAFAPIWIPAYLYTCAKSYRDDVHD